MASKSCENCKKQIPSENYEVHVIHCERNVQICPLCEEPVLKRGQEEHFEEFHAEISCVQCGQKVTRNWEGNHLANECGKRPFPCRYCEIVLPRESLGDHEERCGSRTELCEKCGRYVLMKKIQNHVSLCDGNPDLPCEFCGTLIAPDRLATHQVECFHGQEEAQVPFLFEDSDGVIREFVPSSQNERGREEEGTRGGARRDSVVIETEDAEKGNIPALPCEVCGELCPADKLMEHQFECSQESGNAGNSLSYIRSDPVSIERGLGWRAPAYSDQGFPSEFEFEGFRHHFSAPPGAPNLFEHTFLARLEERLLPFEIIRRSLFSRV